MSESDVGANLMFALAQTTEIKLMVRIMCIGFGHRFVFRFLFEGKHKVCPYIY